MLKTQNRALSSRGHVLHRTMVEMTTIVTLSIIAIMTMGNIREEIAVEMIIAATTIIAASTVITGAKILGIMTYIATTTTLYDAMSSAIVKTFDDRSMLTIDTTNLTDTSICVLTTSNASPLTCRAG